MKKALYVTRSPAGKTVELLKQIAQKVGIGGVIEIRGEEYFHLMDENARLRKAIEGILMAWDAQSGGIKVGIVLRQRVIKAREALEAIK